MTNEELKQIIKDLKDSLWKTATLIVSILVFIGATVNGLVMLYISATNTKVESLQIKYEKIQTSVIRNDSYIRNLEKDTKSTSERLTRMDEKMSNFMTRIENKIDRLQNYNRDIHDER